MLPPGPANWWDTAPELREPSSALLHLTKCQVHPHTPKWDFAEGKNQAVPPSSAPPNSCSLKWQFSLWKLLWDACASWSLVWTTAILSPTHTQHTHAHTEKLPNAYIIWCVNKVPANSPTSGDFKWFQLVPDRAFQTCEKFPFKSTQTQPTQTRTDSRCVSEKTSSVAAKQVLEKAQAGSFPLLDPHPPIDVQHSQKLCLCLSSHTAPVCRVGVWEHLLRDWGLWEPARADKAPLLHLWVTALWYKSPMKVKGRGYLWFFMQKVVIRWWQKFINLYVS